MVQQKVEMQRHKKEEKQPFRERVMVKGMQMQNAIFLVSQSSCAASAVVYTDILFS